MSRFQLYIGLFTAFFVLGGCSGSGYSPSASSGAHVIAGNASQLARQPAAQLTEEQSARLLTLGSRQGLNFVRRDGGGSSLYVSAFYNQPVNNYTMPNPKNQPPSCTISGTNNINAIGVDSSGVLWLPQGDSSAGVVTSYAPHCGAQGITLVTPAQGTAITFGPQGQKYVIVAPYPPGPYIAVFPKGATNPSRILKNKTVGSGYATGVGADSKGNVFLAFEYSSGSGGVVEFLHARGKGQLLGATTAGYPGATVKFDKNKNLLLTDPSNALLDIFAPPYTAVTATIPLKGKSWQCDLNKREAMLACADDTNGTADVYSYPSGTYKYSISNGLYGERILEGIAFDPSAK